MKALFLILSLLGCAVATAAETPTDPLQQAEFLNFPTLKREWKSTDTEVQARNLIECNTWVSTAIDQMKALKKTPIKFGCQAEFAPVSNEGGNFPGLIVGEIYFLP